MEPSDSDEDGVSAASTDGDAGGHPADELIVAKAARRVAAEPSQLTLDSTVAVKKRKVSAAGASVTTEAATTVQQTREEVSADGSRSTVVTASRFIAKLERSGSLDTPVTGGKRKTGSQSATVPAAKRPLGTPIGVVVVDEDEAHPAANPGMNRLLRQPRYFDPDFEAAAVRCYKCGGAGHMARDCTGETRQRPCFLCAQFGHERGNCPNALCFKCSRPGHMARDCPNSYRAAAVQESTVCLRCGREECSNAGASDYLRAEGGCTTSYRQQDLTLVRCYVCGRRGHLCCSPAPRTTFRQSCSNCGEGGHTAEACPREPTAAVRGERRNEALLGQQRADSLRRSRGGEQPFWDHQANRQGFANGYGNERNGGYYEYTAASSRVALGSRGRAPHQARTAEYARHIRYDDL